MLLYLVYLFFFLISSQDSSPTESPTSKETYCLPTGCANSSCICPGFLSFCDTTQESTGVCTATSMFFI